MTKKNQIQIQDYLPKKIIFQISYTLRNIAKYSQIFKLNNNSKAIIKKILKTENNNENKYNHNYCQY